MSKVNHPSHYQMGKMEVAVAMDLLGAPWQWLGHALKYACRAPHKGNEAEDLRKAIWCARRANNTLARWPHTMSQERVSQVVDALTCGVPVDYGNINQLNSMRHLTRILIATICNVDGIEFACSSLESVLPASDPAPTTSGLTISELVRRAHATAVDKGWHDTRRKLHEALAGQPDMIKLVDALSVGSWCAMAHTEISEMVEAYRERGLEAHVREDGKPEGFASEAADVLIRLADTCGEFEIDLEAAVEQKLAFNLSRTYRHGNKAL